MLKIRDAGVTYPGHVAFSGFSLDVPDGDMLSIVGKSGCGKTSLLYAIAGLVPLSGGKIEVEGNAAGCAIMFQQDRLLPWKRAIDNVMIGLPKEQRGFGERMLELVGLSTRMDQYPKQLSGGERQRVALARSLVRNPRLLLLDEPLGSLDEQTRERLQEEIKQYVLSQGITLLLVTHSIQEAVFMGNRIVLMTPEGVASETENPFHRINDLRNRTEFFSLERNLRAQLGGAS